MNQPYRTSDEGAYYMNRTGHPVVDQISAPVLEPGTDVTVYWKLSSAWQATSGQVVIQCSSTHLEYDDKKYPGIGRKVVPWGDNWRWLPA